MRFRTFAWDDWNVEHIARHGLEPPDVEAVCRANALVLRGRGGSYLAYGRTAEGHSLFVVLRSLGQGLARVITAREMTQRERQFYHRRH